MVAVAKDADRCMPLRHCLACGSGFLITYLDLGLQPLANDYHDGTTELARFPLAANVCEDCYHSQLSYSVDPELLFADYSYVSGTSQTLSQYFDWFVDLVEENHGPELSVLDIAGNDGTLLSKFAQHGHTVLNVDPAANLWATSEANDVPTLTAFWDRSLAQAMGARYDVIVAMNVLGHVPAPRDFLLGCADALTDDGALYVQTSQCEMIEHGEFDTIYAEHLSYFTAKSFLRLAKRAGLVVQEVEKVPVHGTSYLWKLGKSGYTGDSVWALILYEALHGYYTDDTYRAFGDRAMQSAAFLSKVATNYRSIGYAVVGYGAAAKGNTVLNAINRPLLDCIIDENLLKVGLLTPGANFPIASLDSIQQIDRPMCVVVLAWNFFDEIVKRVREVRGRTDDVFVRYFPTCEVVTAQ